MTELYSTVAQYFLCSPACRSTSCIEVSINNVGLIELYNLAVYQWPSTCCTHLHADLLAVFKSVSINNVIHMALIEFYNLAVYQ